MRYDLVILDVDGVLTPETTSKAQTEAMLKAVRKYTHKHDLDDQGITRHGRTDEQVLLDLLAKAGRRSKELPTAVVEDYAVAYRSNEHLRPDVKVALEDLCARGWVVTVASGNMGGILERKLAHLGVLQFISQPFGHGGMARERSEILRKVVESRQRFEFNPRAIYVCDTWQDVIAGHQAGLECVMMPSPVDGSNRSWVADGVVENWKELHEWLVRR